MTLRQSNDPYGYKKLLVYKKAEVLQTECATFTATFPREKTLIALADQMDRSARSVKQNIVEGWKRNSTREYYDFLGFSMGANAELEEDCDDIIKGMYEMGGRGLVGMGAKGNKGEEKGKVWGRGEERDWSIEEVEQLPFYPLDTHLPPLIQLKLRAKELTMLLGKLQTSLAEKMANEHTLSQKDLLAKAGREARAADAWVKAQWEEAKKKKGGKGESGNEREKTQGR